MMEWSPTSIVANGDKYSLIDRPHLDNDSLKASTKRISSSNERFGGARNNTIEDKERR